MAAQSIVSLRGEPTAAESDMSPATPIHLIHPIRTSGPGQSPDAPAHAFEPEGSLRTDLCDDEIEALIEEIRHDFREQMGRRLEAA
jgi:hypothetical protein